MQFKLGPVRFDALRMDEVVAYAVKAISDGRRIQLAFANPEMVLEALRNRQLAAYLERCDLVLPDGVGILLANRAIGGVGSVWRVTGTDFAPAICHAAREHGFSVYFLGGRPGVADDAAKAMQAQFPGLRIAGLRHGYFAPEEEAAIVDEVNRSGAAVLMVCLGNPRQEDWIERNREALQCPVVFGNGGALDFYSGRVRRAPILVQELGFEWFFRLVQDPSLARLRRQARLIRFLWLVLVWAAEARGFGRSVDSGSPPPTKGPPENS